MARAKKAPAPEGDPGIGHNLLNELDGLTLDQFEDLKAYFQIKINQAQAHADKIKAELDEAKAEVTALYKSMSGELRIQRQEFKQYLVDQRLPETERLLKLARRARLYRDLEPDGQADLFGQTKDVVSDKQEAYEAGGRAFMRGDFGVPPPELDPMFLQDWLSGYHAKQEETAARMGRAEAFLAHSDSQEAAGETEDDGESEGEPGDDDEEAETTVGARHNPPDPLLN